MSQFTLLRRWTLAQGQCECGRGGHQHAGPCPNRLAVGAYGLLAGEGWYALPRTPVTGEGDEDCELLCWSCYEAVVRVAMAEDPTE